MLLVLDACGWFMTSRVDIIISFGSPCVRCWCSGRRGVSVVGVYAGVKIPSHAVIG